MIIIDNKKTNFHICYDVLASECIRYAANELQKYLCAATKCVVPVFSSKCPCRGFEIHLGLIVRGKNYEHYVNDLSEEGFAIVRDQGDLAIVSKSSRGVLYGVYYFLERFIKLNALDSEMIVYENVEKIEFLEDIYYDLPFEYRECYFTDAFNGKYASMNMLNSNLADLSARLGGKTKWYNFHHSFSDLINPNEYFDKHPEYFSEIDGVRVKEHTELCLSNEEVFELCLKRVKQWIKDNPECKVFSVAQDEWMGHFIKMACECKDCKAFDEEHGSQSASIIRFVNRIASALEEEYPDILIHTFAYQYSRKPPIGLEVHKNVIVRLTNIECSWAESIEEGALRDKESRNASFLNDLIGWSKLTNRLYIWDYSVNYRNYLLPFPCFRSMAKNIVLYKKIGVKGILMQGNFSNGGKGYFDELKSFVSAKLMRGNEKLEDIIEYFCNHYYGKASKYIQEYLYLFEDNIKNKTLWLYDDADSSLFTDEIVLQARDLINKALDAIKDECRLVQKHVKVVELGLRYLELVRMPLNILNRKQLIDKFDEDLREMGITELFERTNLDYSIKVMKNNMYAKERPDWYSLYYIMK